MTEVFLGPPGTGKTTRLLRVVEEELRRGTPPDRIGYLSFTRRAAGEAVGRACEQFKLERKQFPYFSTIHSLCFSQLGLRRGDVLENRRLREFGLSVGIRVTGRWSEDGTPAGFEVGDRILMMDGLARMRGIELREQHRQDDDSLPWNLVEKISRDLAAYKAHHGLHDFTDMLSEFLRSGVRVPLQVLVVDEAQDLSWLQWRVIHYLSLGCRRVCVAGDDDQAIFRWAGAHVEQLIEMEGDVSVLGQSWRVPVSLQEGALRVISRVRHRREKEWRARDGSPGTLDQAQALEDVDTSGEDVLILARNTYILDSQVVPVLRQQGVIYERHEHSSVSPKLLSAISSWEDLRAGRAVTVGEVRLVYEYMSSGRGVARGQKTLPKFQEEDLVGLDQLQREGGLLTTAIWHEALDRLPQDDMRYLRAARQRGEKLRARPRVRLSTIHGSKGGEADHVVLLREMARRTHREMDFNPEDEARVWYVGLTRARERLTLVESTTNRVCPWV